VNHRIIVEKTLDPVLDHDLKISAMFRKMGWSFILGLNGAYYPALVKEFYANMADKKHGILRTIDIEVRGVSIHITREF
jgi:hypothetical protein